MLSPWWHTLTHPNHISFKKIFIEISKFPLLYLYNSDLNHLIPEKQQLTS